MTTVLTFVVNLMSSDGKLVYGNKYVDRHSGVKINTIFRS